MNYIWKSWAPLIEQLFWLRWERLCWLISFVWRKRQITLFYGICNLTGRELVGLSALWWYDVRPKHGKQSVRLFVRETIFCPVQKVVLGYKKNRYDILLQTFCPEQNKMLRRFFCTLKNTFGPRQIVKTIFHCLGLTVILRALLLYLVIPCNTKSSGTIQFTKKKS